MTATANTCELTNYWDSETISAIDKLHIPELSNLSGQEQEFILLFHGEDYLEVLCQLWANGYDQVEYNEKYFDKLMPHLFIVNPHVHIVMTGVLGFCKEVFKRAVNLRSHVAAHKWFLYKQNEHFSVDTAVTEALHKKFFEEREANPFDPDNF